MSLATTTVLLLACMAVLGALVAFALRRRGNRRDERSPATVGSLRRPYSERARAERMLAAYLDPASRAFAVSVRNVRTAIVLDFGLQGRGVVALTTNDDPLDCAWAASNLALAFAQLGPTLLVKLGLGPAVDDQVEAVDSDRASSSTAEAVVRTWSRGSLELVRLADAANLRAAQWAAWTRVYEWTVIDAGGAMSSEDLSALPAGASQLWVCRTSASDPMHASANRETSATRTGVIMIQEN